MKFGTICLCSLWCVATLSVGVYCKPVDEVEVVDFSNYTIEASGESGALGKSGVELYKRFNSSERQIKIHKLVDIKEVYEPVVIKRCDIPRDDGCKSWNLTFMPYHTVTDKKSNQYKFLNSDECYTDTATGLRMYRGRYCIAVGTGYASEIGTKIDVHMKNGSVFQCVLGDVKSDKNTDITNRYHNEDGSVVEMIVDADYFNGTSTYPEGLRGSISYLEIVK